MAINYKGSEFTNNKYLGVQHIANNNDDNFEPQRSNNFELVIYDIENLKTASGKKVTRENITLSVDSTAAPSVSVGVLKVSYGNSDANYAGKAEFGDCTVSFNDYVGIDVAGMLNAWFNLVFDLKNHAIGKKSKYAKKAVLIEYTPDGEINKIWQLHNFWPTSFELGEFSQSDGNIRKISCKFVYDWFNDITDK